MHGTMSAFDDDEQMTTVGVAASTAGSAASGAPPASTAGLFKKSKKARTAAAASSGSAGAAAGAASTNGAAAAAAPAAAAVASGSSSSNRRNASASMSRLSFDEEAEGAAEAAMGGVDSLALRLRLDKEKRKQAKRTERAAAVAATLPAAPVVGTLTTVGSGGGSAYTPEALAALRNNAKHFSSASSADRPPAPARSGLMDGEEMEPEANLAALHRPAPAGTPMALGVGLGAPMAGSFRASGRSKQIALQEADDLRRMVAASNKASSMALGGDAAAAAAEEDGALSRAEELERLAQERQVRAAKLKRERMRATGTLGAGEIAAGQDNDDVSFIPLRSTALAARAAENGGGRVAELDREYGMAVRDELDDDHEANSRLLREDADDALLPEYDDGDDEGNARSDRIAFGDPAARGRRPGDKGSHTQIGALLNKPSRSAAAAAARAGRGDSRRNALMVDDDDEEGGDALMEDDDETRRWEEQMIRAGGAKLNSNGEPARPAGTTRGAQRASGTAITSVAAPTSLAAQIESSTAAVSAASGTAASLVDPGDVFRAGLMTQLNAMSQSHDKLNARFRGVEKALLAEELEQRQLEGKLESASEQYAFYQKLSEQLITSLDCLSEKSRDIRAAWDEMHELKRRRAEEMAQNALLHEQDLWRESAFYSASSSSAAAAPGADTAMHAPHVPQVDEFGRDIAFVAESAADRRKEARIEWFCQQLQPQPQQGGTPANSKTAPRFPAPNPLGWDTLLSLVAQEHPADCERHAAAVASLLSDSAQIFSDTSPEFRSMDAVKGWLEEWKRRFRASYTEAFVPASTPLVLGPYVQLELLQRWDILARPHFSEPAPPRAAADGAVEQSEASWYTKLFDYGMDASNAAPADADGQAEDEDSHLLPTLIESVLVPIVSEFVAHEFDPASLEAHVPALYACMQEAEAHLLAPGQSAQWQRLLTRLLEVFQARIAAHQQRFELVPQLEAGSAAADRDPALLVRQEAYARFRFFQALNLFASLTHFQSLLPTASVKQLASQHLVAALLPFLAWKCVQVDAAFAQGEAAAAAALARGHKEGAAASSLLAASPANETALQQLQVMGARFKAVFPQQWLASKQPVGASSSSNSMTQLYDALNQLQQASDSGNTQLVKETVKQLRTLLHR